MGLSTSISKRLNLEWISLLEVDLAILGSRREHRVIEGIEISVQHWSGMTFEERYDVGKFSPLCQRNNRQRTTSYTSQTHCNKREPTSGIPIHREIEGIDFDEVAVPGILC